MDHDARRARKRGGGRRVRCEHGAGLVEYALLLALIAVACLVSLQVFGVTNGGSVNNTASKYSAAVN